MSDRAAIEWREILSSDYQQKTGTVQRKREVVRGEEGLAVRKEQVGLNYQRMTETVQYGRGGTWGAEELAVREGHVGLDYQKTTKTVLQKGGKF